MLIGIHGKIGAGKDTAADYLVKRHRFENKKFADKLKQITSIMTGCDIKDCYSQEGKNKYLPEWGMTIGEFQQRLGTDAMRNKVHKDSWVLSLFSDYSPNSKWVISDVRFPNEADKIKELGGILIKIVRDIEISHTRDTLHPSETALDTYSNFDYIIENDSSLDMLYLRLENIIL